tara:strand:+ start:936 stop:1748 length:813 start_codon:yes stop_codon:yes gene_type:complete
MAGVFDTISDYASNLFTGDGSTDFYNSLISGGLGYLGSRETANDARDSASQYAQTIKDNASATMAAGQPWSVGGLGGTATFDQDSRTILQNLSPELQNIYEGALDRSGMWGGQATALGADPFKGADMFYNAQQEYLQDDEDQLRNNLETRMMAQGRMGTTGGSRQYGDLERSIGRGQAERRNAAFGQSQALIDSLLGREVADIGLSTGLLEIPHGMAAQGMGLGANLGTLSTAGLKSRGDAADTLNKAFAPSAMGSALSGLSNAFSTKKV